MTTDPGDGPRGGLFRGNVKEARLQLVGPGVLL